MRLSPRLAALVVLTAATARAAPFDPAAVPADARWVVHLDMDALRPTKLWQVIDDQLVGNEAFGSKMGLFEQGSGMRFPRDLHGVTFYGHAAGDAEAVVVVRATMPRGQFMAALQFAPNYAADTYGKYDVAGFDDDNRTLYAAAHDVSTLLFSRSLDALHAALDVLDAKAPAVAAGDPLAAGGKGSPVLYVAALDPAGLAPPGTTPNPLVTQIDHAWLTLAERPAAATTRPSTAPATTAPASPDAVVRLTVTAKSPEAAQQMRAAAGGLRALVAFAAMPRDAKPGVKFAASVLRTMTVTQAGPVTTAEASVGVDQLQQAADRAAAAGDPADK